MIKKPFKFALLNPPEEFVDELAQSFIIAEESIILRGFIQISTSATEKDIKKALSNAIALKHPYIQDNDIEFLAATRRTVTKSVSSSEYNYKNMKMLAGQGSIYVKVKQGLDFFPRPEYDKMSSEDESCDQKPLVSNVERKITDSEESKSSFVEVAEEDEITPFSAVINCTTENNLKTVISALVGYCKTNSTDNPVDILRAAQKYIVCGRPLRIESLDSTIEGATNQIMINS